MNDKIKARRNGIHLPGEQFLILRHHKLKKGYHQAFKQGSERSVWLAYEKIGTRVIGDFEVVYPEGGGSPDYDENYRLACYASYAHWVETRRPLEMMGNGPLFDLLRAGGLRRGQYVVGSDGAYFLTGRMIEDLPYHQPGLDEDYVIAENDQGEERPVRYDIPVPGEGIAELCYWKINKGRFKEFDSLTREGLLPVISKMGARGLGIWQLVYSEGAIGEEHDDFDEVMMITRYASYEHWKASQNPMDLIGNGPDFKAWEVASSRRDSLIQDKWQRFLQGELYRSPPTYIPPLNENYKSV
jgi:hypothetical protein